MDARMTPKEASAGRFSRRNWLVATLSAGAAQWLPRDVRAADEVDKEVAQIQLQAQKAGLAAFRSSITDHYLGIGDAPDEYRKAALKRCAALAAAYRNHFQERGFAVALPTERLTVVTLKDQASYIAFLGNNPGAAVGGHYELDTNRLVIFDFQPGGGPPGGGVDPRKINTFTLIHEATHQLTFNTGVLDRQGDVPVAVSEGLAMYAELGHDGRSALGMINRPRLNVVYNKRNPEQSPEWIPLEKLLTDDSLFQNPAFEQVAYGEAWLLVHYAIKTTAMLPKFRAYLDVIRPRRAATQRLEDATAKLGDLKRLDLTLRKYARVL